jgi:uncharacterized RDD family membrane protein YckC
MTCPACGSALAGGQERCPACGTIVAPAVEGALAPDPARATPPPRAKAGALREVPALRKREKAENGWKDEVRARVQKRKRKAKPESADRELPIFGEAESRREPEAPPESWSQPEPAAPVAPRPEPLELPVRAPAPPSEGAERSDLLPDLELSAPEEPRAGVQAHELDEEAELPLRPAGPVKLDISEPEAYDPLSEEGQSLDEPEREETGEGEWRREDAASDPRPVERPAHFTERLEAGAVDTAVLGGLAAIVVYFASRAAHVPLSALLPVWPWLSGYLVLLGLAYAAYFTGTTGQTPGKMLLGLRVVEASGGPPSYPRAFVRAAAGALGSLLAGAFVLPLFFDPARRAFHDRLFRTRVVKH